MYGYRKSAVTVHHPQLPYVCSYCAPPPVTVRLQLLCTTPQQEPQHDMAVCHAPVSWTDHKGGTVEVRTAEAQKTGRYYVGGGRVGVNDSKIENMAPRSRGFSTKRNKGRKFNIRFNLKRDVSISCYSRPYTTINAPLTPPSPQSNKYGIIL